MPEETSVAPVLGGIVVACGFYRTVSSRCT